jgi:hypothetical protein
MEQLAPLTDSARDEVIILAGRAYREFLVMWLVTFLGYTVSVPMEGLGIGRQLQWLNQAITDLMNGKDISP